MHRTNRQQPNLGRFAQVPGKQFVQAHQSSIGPSPHPQNNRPLQVVRDAKGRVRAFCVSTGEYKFVSL